MGLFDAYDPNTFAPGATQGGLLDRILASVAAAPTNVGPGFPPSPMDAQVSALAPQPVAQPQNAPIAIGDYSMPRIGSGFDLPPGQLDPSTGEHVSAPTAAPVQQPGAPVAPAASNPFSGFLDGMESVAHGGTLLAALRGQPNDAHSVQQRQLLQQHAAYVGAGMTPQQATLAVLNPEAGKAFIAQMVNQGSHAQETDKDGNVWDVNKQTGQRSIALAAKDDKFQHVQTGESGLGQKSFGAFNTKTGETKADAAAAPASEGLGDMTKTGPEYLATIPPQQAGIVKAMVEGRHAPPSSFALSKPYWQNMVQAAQAYDPTFDATNWSGRVAGVKDFAAGKSSEMVRSANQTLHHVNALLDSADALHNGNYPSLNWAGNKLNEATGGGEPGAFKTNAHAVADEMAKVFKGGNLSDSEIRAWEENLSPNMSPTQQRAQIGKLAELLHGSLQALEEKRVASMGQVAADKAGPIIRPEGQKVLQRIDAWLKAGNAAGATGTAPTGVKWSVVK